MHRGHQAALDAPLVVEHLGQRRQGVGGAAGVADDGFASVLLVVHAVDEHRGVVLAGRRHDDLLGACVDVLLAGFLGEEQAGGFEHDVGAGFGPLEGRRVAFLREADLLAVDDQRVAVDRDLTLEAAVHRVVLQHVRQVVGLEQVVDGDDLDVVLEVLNRCAQHVATDAAEAVDTEFDSHLICS
jgi:hypothetical protein